MRAITNNSLQHMGIPGMKWGRKKISSLVSKYKKSRERKQQDDEKKRIAQQTPEYKYDKSMHGKAVVDKALKTKDVTLSMNDSVKKTSIGEAFLRSTLQVIGMVLMAKGAFMAFKTIRNFK